MMDNGVAPPPMARSRSASMPLRSPSMIRCSSRRSTGQPLLSSLAEAEEADTPSKMASSSLSGS